MAKKKAKLDFIEKNDSHGKSEDVASLAAEASEALSALLDAAPAVEVETPRRAKKSKSSKAKKSEENFDEATTEDMVAAASEAEALENEGLVIQEETDSSEDSLQASSEDSEELETEDQDSEETMESGAETDESEDGLQLADAEESEESDELSEFGTTNIFTEEEPTSFLPEATEEALEAADGLESVESVEGTELDAFESAQIEEVEFVEEEQLDSIVESVLFASDRPVSLNSLKLVFKGTNIRGDKIKRALERLAVELASGHRGVSLEEVPGGYQLRTKVDNLQFLTRTLKARQFKLSGPALEVLAIVAYKQPLIKHEIDEIRGVESGHLLRALMEKGLVNFEGKSDLPGKPMLYSTTKKFLEIFGLRNLKELPTLSQIDELLPEGMTEEEAKPTLSQVTDAMSQTIGTSYSEGEDELMKITDQLGAINSSSDFFEQEKERQRMKRDAERAQNIREAMAMDEQVPTRDRNWLAKYDEAAANGTLATFGKPQPPAFFAKKGQADAGLDAEAVAGDLESAILAEDAEMAADGIEMQLGENLDIEAIEDGAETAFNEEEVSVDEDSEATLEMAGSEELTFVEDDEDSEALVAEEETESADDVTLAESDENAEEIEATEADENTEEMTAADDNENEDEDEMIVADAEEMNPDDGSEPEEPNGEAHL